MTLTKEQHLLLAQLNQTTEWEAVQPILAGMIGEQLVATMYASSAVEVDAARFAARGLTMLREAVASAPANLAKLESMQTSGNAA